MRRNQVIEILGIGWILGAANTVTGGIGVRVIKRVRSDEVVHPKPNFGVRLVTERRTDLGVTEDRATKS